MIRVVVALPACQPRGLPAVVLPLLTTDAQVYTAWGLPERVIRAWLAELVGFRAECEILARGEG